jgi:hypothetical protein
MAGHVVDHCTASSAEVKNEWSYTSTHQHAFNVRTKKKKKTL